ncbi:MarR family winged helix-turn-helix transcriptional regulator [Microbacterium sp. SLBN-111]|uniref:MarR family winged helix-turn-helix transcriptional regulator n=1 Tax=Microbacterium sp. SLBN-111 TaxID=3377733 RepID=UPI003C79009F
MTTPLDTRFASADESPGFLLWQVTNRWQAAVRRALAPFDVTHVQFVLLAVLTYGDVEAGLTQAEVSRRAGADPMMVSQVLRALAARGLVERTPDAIDRRAVRVRATAEGRALARTANHAVEDVDDTFFGPGAAASGTLVGHLSAVLDRSREPNS